MNYLLDKIKNKKSKVLIIGLGYVGWPFITIKKKGFDVMGLDTNRMLVQNYKKKTKNLFYLYKDINFKEIDVIIIVYQPLSRIKDPISHI